MVKRTISKKRKYALNRDVKPIKIDSSTDNSIEFVNNQIIKKVPEGRVSIEKPITYTIYTTIPEDYDGLGEFVISDYLQPAEGMSELAGFMVDGSLKFSFDGAAPTHMNNVEWDETREVVGNYNGSEIVSPNNKTGFKVDLKDTTLTNIAGKQLKITYDVVFTDAAINKTINNKFIQTVANSNGAEFPTEVSKPITLYKATIVVHKRDLEDKSQGLPGAKFQLQKNIGTDGNDNWMNVGDVKSTNQSGDIIWDNVGLGNYRVIETQAPTYEYNGKTRNYVILNETTEIILDDSNNLDAENPTYIYNRKAMWYLPGTGGIGYFGFTALSVVLIAIGLGIFGYKKKKAQA